MFPQHANPRTKVSIIDLNIIRTGTFQQQQIRPWQSVATEESIDRIIDTIHRFNHSTDDFAADETPAGLFSKISTEFIAPSAAPVGEVPMLGSVRGCDAWGESRYRFVMTLHMTTPTGAVFTTIIQGYTSHAGINEATGSIDPYMEFIINSMVEMSDVRYPDGRTDVTIRSSGYLVDGSSICNHYNGDVFKSRPYDIFNAIKGIRSENMLRQYADDASTKYLAHRLNGESMYTRSQNNIPSEIVGGVVQAVSKASLLSNYGQTTMNIHDQARAMMVEDDITASNPFLRALSKIRVVAGATTFTLNELVKIDPTIQSDPNKIKIHRIRPEAMRALACRNNSMPMTGVDLTTVSVDLLSKMLPALALKFGLTKFSLRSTNRNPGGRLTTVYTSEPRSFSVGGRDALAAGFLDDFDREIVYALTQQNMLNFAVDIWFDVFDTIIIELAIGDEMFPSRVEVPAFCGNLLTPVYNPNELQYNTLVGDVDRLARSIIDAAPRTELQPQVAVNRRPALPASNLPTRADNTNLPPSMRRTTPTQGATAPNTNIPSIHNLFKGDL